MKNDVPVKPSNQEKAPVNLAVVRVDPRDQAITAMGLCYNKV